MFADSFTLASIHCIARKLCANFLYKCPASRGSSLRQHGVLVNVKCHYNQYIVNYSYSSNIVITSGQSNLTQGRIASADGRFNRIHQVAPMCPPALQRRHTGATWRIRLNLCFIRPTRVPKPNGKSIGSAISAQLTAECRRECLGMSFSLIIMPLCMRDMGSI